MRMNRKFLFRINVLLGVVSLWLAGCHSSKSATKEGPARPMLKYGVPEVRAMYGVATPEAQPADTLSAPADTVVMPEPRQVPPSEREIIVVKYGVPGRTR